MKKIIISLLAVTAMAGCTKSEQQDIVANDGEIHAFVGIENPATRAVVDMNTGIGTDEVAFRLIHAGNEPSDFSAATALKGTIASSSGEVTFNPVPKYETENDYNAYFIGYYPAGNESSGVVTWTIDGQTDILRTDAVWSAGRYSANAIKGMKFNHQLSQVEVICKAEANTHIDAVRADWGQIKSISFVDAPTTMTYTLSTLAVDNGTTKEDKALFADYNGTVFSIDIPESSNTDINARAMLAPVNKASEEKSFELKVVTEGPSAMDDDDDVIIVPVKIGTTVAENMVKGKKHVVTLTFKVTAKEIVASDTKVIDAWTDGSTGTGDVVRPTN